MSDLSIRRNSCFRCLNIAAGDYLQICFRKNTDIRNCENIEREREKKREPSGDSIVLIKRNARGINRNVVGKSNYGGF